MFWCSNLPNLHVLHEPFLEKNINFNWISAWITDFAKLSTCWRYLKPLHLGLGYMCICKLMSCRSILSKPAIETNSHQIGQIVRFFDILFCRFQVNYLIKINFLHQSRKVCTFVFLSNYAVQTSDTNKQSIFNKIDLIKLIWYLWLSNSIISFFLQFFLNFFAETLTK